MMSMFVYSRSYLLTGILRSRGMPRPLPIWSAAASTAVQSGGSPSLPPLPAMGASMLPSSSSSPFSPSLPTPFLLPSFLLPFCSLLIFFAANVWRLEDHSGHFKTCSAVSAEVSYRGCSTRTTLCSQGACELILSPSSLCLPPFLLPRLIAHSILTSTGPH